MHCVEQTYKKKNHMPLTTSQNKVINFPYIPSSTLNVVAGPGSGKTLTLLEKVYHLVKDGNSTIRPDEILILSLTNKAVDNVIDKLSTVFIQNERFTENELENILQQINISTIHGLANKIVTECDGVINIIEENGWRGLAKLISKASRSTNVPKSTLIKPKLLENLLRSYKNSSSTSNSSQMTEIELNTINDVVEIMKDCDVMTNDDLIIRATEYVKDSNEKYDGVFNMVNKYKIILIDEVQDLYPSLLPLIKQISSGKQLILFGDTNQSIYEFMGGNKIVLDELNQLHAKENTHTLHLYDNFRCTPEIIGLATEILPQEKQRLIESEDLIIKSKSSVDPQVHEFDEDIEQLEFIIDEISKLVCTNSVEFSDIAILTRTNAFLSIVADHLKSYGIPFEKLSATPDWVQDQRIHFIIDLLKFITMAHKKDESNKFEPYQTDFNLIVTLSYLKGIGNISLQNLYRICRSKRISIWDYISENSIDIWPSGIANKNKIKEFVSIVEPYVVEGTFEHMESPMDIVRNIDELLSQIDTHLFKFDNHRKMLQFKTNFEEMVKTLKLCHLDKPVDISLTSWFLETYFDRNSLQHDKILKIGTGKPSQSLKISTIHSSKGLEFPIAMLVEPPKSTLNHNFPIDTNTLYVGMTRARNLLYLMNINHPKLNSHNFQNKNISSNQNFWNYYNKDLQRNAINKTINMANYTQLQKRFGIRTLHTISSILVNSRKIM